MSGTNQKDENITPDITMTEPKEKDYSWVKWVVGGIIILYFATKNKPINMPKNDEEIIKFVANELYREKGLYFNKKIDNVRTQRGAPGETYVEFLKEHITYLYLDDVGIVERYPGESIKNVKEGKQGDEIEMELAKSGVAKKKILDIHNARLEAYNLTEEEN